MRSECCEVEQRLGYEDTDTVDLFLCMTGR